MARLALIAVLAGGLMGVVGCTTHLFFVEHAHMGLRAQISVQGPSPGEVTIGYRRGLVAIIPERSAADLTPAARIDHPGLEKELEKLRAEGQETILVKDDPEDLMSLYTLFRANVGFGDPVDTCHFLATGRAAAYLLQDVGSVDGIPAQACRASATNGEEK